MGLLAPRAVINTGALDAIEDASTDPLIMWNCNPTLPQMSLLGFVIGGQGVGLITIFNGTHVHTTTVLAAVSLSAV